MMTSTRCCYTPIQKSCLKKNGGSSKGKYNTDHSVAIDYLRNDLLEPWGEKVLKYHTNDLMHFGNTTTLRAEEGGHSRIK